MQRAGASLYILGSLGMRACWSELIHYNTSIGRNDHPFSNDDLNSIFDIDNVSIQYYCSFLIGQTQWELASKNVVSRRKWLKPQSINVKEKNRKTC